MKFSSTLAYFLLGAASLALKEAKAETSPFSGPQHVFIRGAALTGGTNGMFFDNDNYLLAAQVYGRAISKLNATTGEVVGALGYEESVVFPDDVTVSPVDGTLFWSDYFYFETIMTRGPTTGGESVPLLPPGSVPFANPVTLDANGKRLFYAQCWNPEPVNGVYELNLATSVTTPLLEDIPGCASNAMDFWDEAIYTPRPYEGRIVMIDLAANNTVSNVTTGWGGAPNALKFDSQGRLYATNTAIGEVALVDYNNSDTENNRQVIAQFPAGSVDNLALDKDDRLFVSSTSDGDIVEVLSSGELRTVSRGQFSIPMGVAILNDMLFTVHPGALFGFDSSTGERKLAIRSIPGGAGDAFLEPTSLTVWNNSLVLMSFPFGALDIYDPITETKKLTTFFTGPIDAHPFQDGLIVTQSQNGTVVWASGADLGERQVIYTSPGVAYLAGNDTDVYLTDLVDQTLYQIIKDGKVLSSPIAIATGFDAPEGIVLVPGDKILLVDAGKGTLEEVDLLTGEVTTLAIDMGFLPGIPGIEFGFGNDVAIDDRGAIYVNGDSANVIYKFYAVSSGDDASTTSAAVSIVDHSPWWALMTLSLICFVTSWS